MGDMVYNMQARFRWYGDGNCLEEKQEGYAQEIETILQIGLTLMSFVHELEELVDDGLEELPVCFKESRILTNNIHDVGRDNSFVVLPPFDLAKPKKILDYSNKETFLLFLV